MLEQAFSLVFHTKSMSGIIDDFEAVGVGDPFNVLHVAGISITVHGQDGRGLRGNCRLNFVRVQIAGRWVDVDKNRLDPVPHQGMRGGDEGVWGGDDFARDPQGL